MMDKKIKLYKHKKNINFSQNVFLFVIDINLTISD